MAVSRREFCTGLAGGVLAKKTGDEVLVFRPDASKMPVKVAGGTVPRALADRFADIVNVKDFGAKGDGTTDDVAAFASAAEAGSVFVPRGEYNVGLNIHANFYSDSEVDAGEVDVVDVPKAARKVKLLEIATSLASKRQVFSSSKYPNHPHTTYYFQSICYDSERDLFYLGQANVTDETQQGYIYKTNDPTDPESLTDVLARVDGHYNDMTYDAKNDCVYVFPSGSNNSITNKIYVINPGTGAVTTWETSDTTYRFYIGAVCGDYLYVLVGGASGNIVRYNTSTKSKDTSFSIKPSDYKFPVAPNEEYTPQSMFFVGDVLVIAGLVQNTEVGRQRKTAFKIFDINSKDCVFCGYNVDNRQELECCDVKDNVIYQLLADTYRAGIAVSPVGLFTASDVYSKVVDPSVDDYRYVDFDDIVDEGVYLIKDATALGNTLHAPVARQYAGGRLVVNVTASGEIVEQTLFLVSGEIYKRLGSFQTNTWKSWEKHGFLTIYKGSDTTSCNDFTMAGVVHPFGLTNAPEGDYGFILTLKATNPEHTKSFLKQFYFRTTATLNTLEHQTFVRQGIIESGSSPSFGNWTKFITNNDSFSNDFYPSATNTYSLGKSIRLWSVVYAASGSINTSDERLKESIEAPSDALMRAWGKVNFKVFQFKDAIAKKGDEARIHVGVIAQQIQAAFASEGLDAGKYGLFCYDKWDDEYIEEKMIDKDAVLDDEGKVISPEETHMERKLVQKAGDLYSVRYEECLALECAYQRHRAEQAEVRLSELEERLTQIESRLQT